MGWSRWTFTSYHKRFVSRNNNVDCQRLFQRHLDEFLETDPLLLKTDWQECGGGDTWSRKATVLIFSDEDKYNEYLKWHGARNFRTRE